MLFQRWNGVEELDFSGLNVVLVDSISLFLGLQTMGEVLERREYCRRFCWGALQTAWHFKKCQDTLVVKGYSFVPFMSPYSLFPIVILRVAALDHSLLTA